MKTYAVAFEVFDVTGELVAKVECFDHETAKIEVLSVHDYQSWPLLSAEIQKALEQMRDKE